MGIHITTAGNTVTKKENFLVNTIVFFTFWSFFTGFPIAFNGVFRTMLGGRFGMLLLFLQLIIYLYSSSNNPRSFSKANQKYALVFVVALLSVSLWTFVSISEFDSSLITPLFSIPFFILLRDDLKVICLDRFIRLLAVILTLSLFEYFIYVFFNKGILLLSGLGRIGSEDNYFIDSYNQYLLNVISTHRVFPRFQCLCEEPGCIGTLSGFLIYVTKGRKEYTYQYFIFIIAGVFSFSLAFFALYALHFLLNVRSSSITLVILLLMFILAYYVFMDIFQDMLLYRLEGGLDVADNRIAEGFSDVYAKAWSNGELWLPHGNTGGSFGAGAKMWIWIHGIISLIIVFISYLYIYWRKVKETKSSKWECFIFFLAFWVSFYQRHWIMNIDYLIVYVTTPILYSYLINNKKIRV